MRKQIAVYLAIFIVTLTCAACTTSQLAQAESLAGLIIQDIPPVLEILAGAGVLSQPTLTQAQAAAGQAGADFSLVKTLIADYQKQPTATTQQKILAALQDGETNLQAIMTAAHIVNPQTRQTVQGAVTLLINTAQQIAAIFPAAATPAAVSASNGVKLPTPSQFQKEFNSLINR